MERKSAGRRAAAAASLLLAFVATACVVSIGGGSGEDGGGQGATGLLESTSALQHQQLELLPFLKLLHSALREVVGQKLVSGGSETDSAAKGLLSATQKLESFGWADTDVNCSFLVDYTKEKVDFEQMLEQLRVDNATRTGLLGVHKKTLDEKVQEYQSAVKTYEDLTQLHDSAAVDATEAVKLLGKLKAELASLQQGGEEVNGQLKKSKKELASYLQSIAVLRGEVGQLQASINNGNREEYESRLFKIDLFVSHHLSLYADLAVLLKSKMQDLEHPSEAVRPVLVDMEQRARQGSPAIEARGKLLASSVADVQEQLLDARQDLVTFSTERDKNQLLLLQAKAPLQKLEGAAAGARITFAGYMREHNYGERVAAETTDAAQKVVARLAEGIAACAATQQVALEKRPTLLEAPVPGQRGKLLAVPAGEGATVGGGVPSGEKGEGHTGKLVAVGRAGVSEATLQDVSGLVHPLASAFSDALNESKREHAAVVEHTKHPVRTVSPAEGAVTGAALAKARGVAHAAPAPAAPAPNVLAHAARGAPPLQESKARVTGLHLLTSRLAGVWGGVWDVGPGGGDSGGATDK